jgi:hypothetical protein
MPGHRRGLWEWSLQNGTGFSPSAGSLRIQTPWGN